MMSSGLMLDVLDVVLADTSATLVPPERISPLRLVASLLPPVPSAGLELRLASGGPVDLQQNIVARDGLPGIAARHITHLLADARLETAPGWDRVEHFLCAWTDSATSWQGMVHDLWLEFDLPTSPAQALPLPAVFIGLASGGLAGGESAAALEPILAAILGAPIPPTVLETLSRCVARCSDRGRITHVGLMLSRPNAAIRLNVARVPAERIVPYLEAIGWPGSAARVESLLDRLFPLVDGITLALDVGASVGSRLGLECVVRERSVPGPRQTALLNLLVELDCCTAAERDALVAWPRVIGPPQSRAPWPAALIVTDIARPANGLCGISSALNHVKLEVVDEEPLRAKAYLYFHTRWLGAPEEDSAAQTIAGALEIERSLEDGIEGALHFLSNTRGQSGLWRDFYAQDGGSDEWVSSVVGGVLAEVPRARAQQEAFSTWRILARRARSGGGWGWNVVTAPDADTTTWTLRLAEAIGAGRTEALRLARRFLQQHCASDGGIGTYAPLVCPDQELEAIKGWTAVHDDVTAAAASLPGAIGAGARRRLRSSQQKDGSWRAYWWSDDAYATALAAEALASRGISSDGPRVAAAVDWALRRVAADGAVSTDALGGPSPFTTAWVIRALALGSSTDHVRDALERASAWLAGDQKADGSWRSAADMWVPPRDVEPDDLAKGDGLPIGTKMCFDERRIFTTAVALSALVRAKKVVEGRNGSSAPPSRADALPVAPRR